MEPRNTARVEDSGVEAALRAAPTSTEIVSLLAAHLAAAGRDEAQLQAEWLVSHTAGVPRLELAARWRPAAAWQLGGHWSYTRARYENFVETLGSGASAVTVSRAGKTPANVPRVVAGLSADWQAHESLRLGADWRHVGKRYANTANTLWDEAYQLLGLSATLRITPQLTARARIDNVADTRYVASLSSSLPYLGAPRSVSGALDWQF